MATIIKEAKLGEVRKGSHSCFEKANNFLKGILQYGNYCPVCGEKLIEKKEVIIFKCSMCGEPILANLFDYNYCPNCGAKFKKED